MDMNPFANNNSQATPTPDYLKQNPRANGSVPGAVGNMVKAIMEGNNKFQQRGGMAGAGMGDTPGGAIPGASGPTSFGGSAGPMPLAPMGGAPMGAAPPMAPSTPSPVMTSLNANAGGTGPMPMAPSAFESGPAPVPFMQSMGMTGQGEGGWPGMPNGPDKSMSALFSQIPGMGGGGFFGG